MNEPLKAPMPWFGGKSRAAHLIWPRFGDVPNYVEPFFGSGAVLLARPHVPRIETVNDYDAFLANFWRAIRIDPTETARWADAPVNEADLHAVHRWLVNRAEFRERMRRDPDYFDAQIAGRWVWGLCAWIGSGWCAADPGGEVSDRLPAIGGMNTPDGASASKGTRDGGRGVHSKAMRGGTGGSGILATFEALSRRLRGVRVACGDFERVLSDSVTWRHGTTAILLDPPYADGEEVYSAGNDACGTFARAAAWAAEHGADKRLRIALCGYEGTWSPPTGWETVAWKARGGYGAQRADGSNENAKRERLWFSPGCLRADATENAGPLFAAVPR